MPLSSAGFNVRVTLATRNANIILVNFPLQDFLGLNSATQDFTVVIASEQLNKMNYTVSKSYNYRFNFVKN